MSHNHPMLPWFCLMFGIICVAILLVFRLDAIVKARQEKARAKREEKQAQQKRLKGETLSKREQRRRHIDNLLTVTKLPPPMYQGLTVVSVIGGFFVGKLLFADTLLAIITAAAAFSLPSVYLEVVAKKMSAYNMEKLQNSMSIITNAYQANGDIIKSIQDSMDMLEYPAPFQEFLTNITLLDANIDKALYKLAERVPNKYVSQWVDALVLSQTDRNMMQVLPAIIDQMNDTRQDQMEADTVMASIWREFITIFAVACAVPIVFRVVIYDWFITLTTTIPGRIIMASLVFAMIRALKRATEINQPFIHI